MPRVSFESHDAVRRIVRAELQPLHQAIIELKTALRPATQRTRADSLHPRKEFIAGIIMSRPPYPKMSVSAILSEADTLQHRFPKKAHYRPPPAWKVRFWADMKGDNRAQAWIAGDQGGSQISPPRVPYQAEKRATYPERE
jgi:hypothetical protein